MKGQDPKQEAEVKSPKCRMMGKRIIIDSNGADGYIVILQCKQGDTTERLDRVYSLEEVIHGSKTEIKDIWEHISLPEGHPITGACYVFEVVAVDKDGNQSVPTLIPLTTEEGKLVPTPIPSPTPTPEPPVNLKAKGFQRNIRFLLEKVKAWLEKGSTLGDIPFSEDDKISCKQEYNLLTEEISNLSPDKLGDQKVMSDYNARVACLKQVVYDAVRSKESRRDNKPRPAPENPPVPSPQPPTPSVQPKPTDNEVSAKVTELSKRLDRIEGELKTELGAVAQQGLANSKGLVDLKDGLGEIMSAIEGLKESKSPKASSTKRIIPTQVADLESRGIKLLEEISTKLDRKDENEKKSKWMRGGWIFGILALLIVLTGLVLGIIALTGIVLKTPMQVVQPPPVPTVVAVQPPSQVLELRFPDLSKPTKVVDWSNLEPTSKEEPPVEKPAEPEPKVEPQAGPTSYWREETRFGYQVTPQQPVAPMVVVSTPQPVYYNYPSVSYYGGGYERPVRLYSDAYYHAYNRSCPPPQVNYPHYPAPGQARDFYGHHGSHGKRR